MDTKFAPWIRSVVFQYHFIPGALNELMTQESFTTEVCLCLQVVRICLLIAHCNDIL